MSGSALCWQLSPCVMEVSTCLSQCDRCSISCVTIQHLHIMVAWEILDSQLQELFVGDTMALLAIFRGFSVEKLMCTPR